MAIDRSIPPKVVIDWKQVHECLRLCEELRKLGINQHEYSLGRPFSTPNERRIPCH